MHRRLLLLLILLPAWAQNPAAKPGTDGWTSLFDGTSLKGWSETPFTRHGTVSIADGAITLGTGYMTGITWAGSFPHSNYEIRLEAARIDGNDFFAGITFPVGDSFCTWINGGWGGTLVGLSSLNGNDASENETGVTRTFEKGRWYRLRLRVTDDRIQAWIDEQPVIDVPTADYEIGLRPGETELSKPLGIASYSTLARLRKLEYRVVEPSGK
ncbi:MAG TPA: DUF1080 domain-containing protein [Bryobacteraceae bacterium]